MKRMIASVLVIAMVGGCGMRWPSSARGPTIAILGAAQAAVVATYGPLGVVYTCLILASEVPLDERGFSACMTTVRIVVSSLVVAGAGAVVAGVVLTAMDMRRPSPRVEPPPAEPPLAEPRARSPRPLMSREARSLDRVLRLQVAGDLCRDAAATLAELRAIDPAAAERALADLTTARCVMR